MSSNSYSYLQKEITLKGHERTVLAKTCSMNKTLHMQIRLALVYERGLSYVIRLYFVVAIRIVYRLILTIRSELFFLSALFQKRLDIMMKHRL